MSDALENLLILASEPIATVYCSGSVYCLTECCGEEGKEFATEGVSSVVCMRCYQRVDDIFSERWGVDDETGWDRYRRALGAVVPSAVAAEKAATDVRARAEREQSGRYILAVRDAMRNSGWHWLDDQPHRSHTQVHRLYADLCDSRGEGLVTCQTVTCWTCKHSVYAHYGDGHGGGCVAENPAPLNLNAAYSGEQTHLAHLPGADGSCLCPGFRRGGLPEGVTKYLRGLDAHDGERCPDCSHELLLHGDRDPWGSPYGCWACPCSHSDIPARSIFEIHLDARAIDYLSDPRVAATRDADIRVGGGWISLQMLAVNMVGIDLRMSELGLAATFKTHDSIWSSISLGRPCDVPMKLTNCWLHDNCDPTHIYQVRLMRKEEDQTWI